jgi:hypothetical protein
MVYVFSSFMEKLEVNRPQLVTVGHWRNTEAGGFTAPLVLKIHENKIEILRPVLKKYSKSKSHGKFIYIGEADVVLHMDMTSGGYKEVFITRCRTKREICEYLRDTVLWLWQEGGSYRAIQKALELLQLPPL